MSREVRSKKAGINSAAATSYLSFLIDEGKSKVCSDGNDITTIITVIIIIIRDVFFLLQPQQMGCDRTPWFRQDESYSFKKTSCLA